MPRTAVFPPSSEVSLELFFSIARSKSRDWISMLALFQIPALSCFLDVCVTPRPSCTRRAAKQHVGHEARGRLGRSGWASPGFAHQQAADGTDTGICTSEAAFCKLYP